MVKGFRNHSVRNHRSPFLIAISFLFLSSEVLAATATLESAVLRLELNTSPYSYQVVERSSGKLLLSQSSTGVTFGPELYPASEAANVSKTTNSLQAELVLQLAGRESMPQGTPASVQVSFSFVKPEVLQVSITHKGASPSEISEEFNDQGEHYYGIWEHPFGGSLDNRGADRDFLGMGNERYVHHASARAPFYMTSNRYGIYVESLAQAHYAIAQAGKTTFSFKAAQLKYHIIYGPSYADILNRYNALAGPAFMPPTWAFSSIWWRDDQHADLRGVINAQEKVLQDADRLRSLHLPAGAIWLDRPYASGELGWGAMDFDSSFPDPAKMIHDLSDRGMNLLLWTANRRSGDLFKEGQAKSYLFPLQWPAADIRRPQVYDWFKQKLNVYVRMGVKGYKIDRGEEKEIPQLAENELAVLFPKLSAEGLSAAYGKDYFIFSRNANDTTRKYSAIWNGDSWSTFEGLQVSIKNGLRSGTINFPMWGSDTGGYFAPPAPDNDLLARWLEFGAYSPMMEVILGPQRTLWDDYSQEVIGVAQKYVAAHHDLIPYTRSAMYQATETGMPIMRALILAYPDDERLGDMWDEYLYGDALLVAPVTAAQTTERSVYLPAGRWMNYDDKRTVYGGATTVKAIAPLGTIPVYVRESAIVPRGDIVKLNNNWDTNWNPKLRVEFFPSRKQKSRFDYYTGRGVQRITAEPGRDSMKIEFGDLETPGMVEVYCKNVKGVSLNGVKLREGVDYRFDQQVNRLTIPFNGASKIAVEGAESLF
jgi:alpha-D-xyloside xylohydrolase